MTGTRDITTCADIVTENISELNFHGMALFLLKIISWMPIPGRTLLKNGIHYRDSDSLLRGVNSMLQHGTNISVSEICAKWSVFSGTVTYCCISVFHM